MATVKLTFVALSMMLALASCGSASRERVSAAVSGVVDAGGLGLEALDPQPLSPGACGMFLWARAAGEPVFVFAAFSQPPGARVKVRGRERRLARTAAQGAAASGHFERQTFADGSLALTVDVTFDTSRRVVDGSAIERGVIRIEDSEGWETIIPVGGLVACEN
nr:hypothetical protein [Nitrosomonas nitrosa]